MREEFKDNRVRQLANNLKSSNILYIVDFMVDRIYFLFFIF